MAQNLHCPCLCHDDTHSDRYFCCKPCYAAFHMEGLPREPHKPKASKPRKVRPTKAGYVPPPAPEA